MWRKRISQNEKNDSEYRTPPFTFYKFISHITSHKSQINDCKFPQSLQIRSKYTRAFLSSLHTEIANRWKVHSFH